MYSPDISELNEEFNRRIKHDLGKYLLLKSNGVNLNEDAILQSMCEMKGYKRHKKVHYGEYTSHIIVKFIDEYAAREATARINLMTYGLTAVLLDDMLRTWFIHEKKICPGPTHSLTIVDIIGNPPLNLNFLTSNILSTIFQDFGAPYLLPYTAALNEPHMQVFFYSMTEALAACMAFGEWYCREDKADCFFYRVRINPSNEEGNLIRKCGGIPTEAFKLAYFITLKAEAKFEQVKDSVAKRSKHKTSATECIHKKRKQEYLLSQCCKSHQANPFGHGTPIVYFPLIATNHFKAHTCTNNQLGAGFTTALLNLQQTFPPQAVNIVANPATGNNVARQYKNSEEISERTDDKKSEHQSNISQINSNRNFQRQIQDSIKLRGIHRRTTRIFERKEKNVSKQP